MSRQHGREYTSPSIALIHIEGKGRAWRATEAIPANTILIRERPEREMIDLITWRQYPNTARKVAAVLLARRLRAGPTTAPRLDALFGDNEYTRAKIRDTVDYHAYDLWHYSESQRNQLLDDATRVCLNQFESNGDLVLGFNTSVFNHSCAANTLSRSEGGDWNVVSVRTIAVNEEICICYATETEAMGVEERKSYLRENWGFECQCERCEADIMRAQQQREQEQRKKAKNKQKKQRQALRKKAVGNDGKEDDTINNKM